MRRVETRHFHAMFSFSLWTMLALFLVLLTVAGALMVGSYLNGRDRRRRRRW